MQLHIFGALIVLSELWFYSVNSISVSSEKMSWYQAANNTECSLYGLNRTGELKISQVTYELQSLSSFQGTWIGAHVEYTDWYKFSVCYYYRVRKGSQGFSVKTSDDPIEDCVIYCNSSASFYITVSKCYCEKEINENVKQSKSCQGRYCLGGQGDYCGTGDVIGPYRNHNLTCLCRYTIMDSGLVDKGRTENSNLSSRKSTLTWGVLRNKNITDCVFLEKNNSIIIAKTQSCTNDHYALCTFESSESPKSTFETTPYILNTTASSTAQDESTSKLLYTDLEHDKRTDFTIFNRNGTNVLTTYLINSTPISTFSSPLTQDHKISNGNTLQWNSQLPFTSVDSPEQNMNSSVRDNIETSTMSSFTKVSEVFEHTGESTYIAMIIGPVASIILIVLIVLGVVCYRKRIEKKSPLSDHEMQESVRNFDHGSIKASKKKGVTDFKTSPLENLPGHNNNPLNKKEISIHQENFYDRLNAKSNQNTRDVDFTYDHARFGSAEDAYGSLVKDNKERKKESDYNTMVEAREFCGTDKNIYDYLNP